MKSQGFSWEFGYQSIPQPPASLSQVQYLQSRGHSEAVQLLQKVPKTKDPYEQLGQQGHGSKEDGLNSHECIQQNQLETILPGILKLGTLNYIDMQRLHTIYGNMMKHDVQCICLYTIYRT